MAAQPNQQPNPLLALQNLLKHPNTIVQEEAITLVAMKKKTIRDCRPGPWGYGPLAAWLQETFKEETRLALDQTLGLVRLGYLQLSLYSPSVPHNRNPMTATKPTSERYSQLVTHYRSNVLESVP